MSWEKYQSINQLIVGRAIKVPALYSKRQNKLLFATYCFGTSYYEKHDIRKQRYWNPTLKAVKYYFFSKQNLTRLQGKIWSFYVSLLFEKSTFQTSLSYVPWFPGYTLSFIHLQKGTQSLKTRAHMKPDPIFLKWRWHTSTVYWRPVFMPYVAQNLPNRAKKLATAG